LPLADHRSLARMPPPARWPTLARFSVFNVQENSTVPGQLLATFLQVPISCCGATTLGPGLASFRTLYGVAAAVEKGRFPSRNLCEIRISVGAQHLYEYLFSSNRNGLHRASPAIQPVPHRLNVVAESLTQHGARRIDDTEIPNVADLARNARYHDASPASPMSR